MLSNTTYDFSKYKGNPLLEFEKNPYWKGIKIDPEIKIGVATSEYQVSGGDTCDNSNWRAFEKSKEQGGPSYIERDETSGVSLNFWNCPEDLIAKLKELGLKEYRFSVEWSKICPEKDSFSQEAMNYYVNLCKRLIEEGIEPCVTLHHFSDPIWFQEQGGFEHEQNIPDFVKFSEKVFENLSPYVKNWITINEPSVYAFQGWVRGVFPPAKSDVGLAGTVLKNLMIAHCDVYDALKKLDGNCQSRIGIAHQAIRFRPYSEDNPIEVFICNALTKISHKAVMDFFKTGEFKFDISSLAIPMVTEGKQLAGWVDVAYSRPDIHEKLDFFAVQYYTDPLISMIWKSTHYNGEKMTYMPFRFYPQGLASLLDECREIKKPIWITETGTAAPEADQKEFIKKALKVASFAKSQGVPLERVYLWTLADNFEWNMGWMEKPGFGLYEFNPKTREYRMRASGQFVQKLLQKQDSSLKMEVSKKNLLI